MATRPHLFADSQCGASSLCDIDFLPLRFTLVAQDRRLYESYLETAFEVVIEQTVAALGRLTLVVSMGRRNTSESFDPTALPMENQLQSTQT